MSEYPTEDAMEVEVSSQQPQTDEADDVELENGLRFQVPKGSPPEISARLQMEVDEQDLLLRELAYELDRVRPDQIPSAFEKFGFKLQQLQEKHGPFKSLGYAGLKSLPMALGAIFTSFQNSLPEEFQTQEWQDSELCANVIRRLKAKWNGSPIAVLLYSEMLIPGSLMIRNASLLRQQEFDWIREAARVNLQQAMESAREGIPMDAKIPLFLEHWEQLVHGSLPSGFNSEYEHRYSTLDVDYLMDPSLPDPTDALKQLSAYQIAYLDRISREQLEAVEAGQITRSPEQIAHLNRIANRQYPHGFQVKE
jgi:hypothetical protein